MRYFLDTTLVIDLLRGQPTARSRFAKLFEDGDLIYVNEIVVCEAAAGSHVFPNLELLGLLRPLEFIQPGPESALAAGRWRAEARRQGRVLSLADSLIAAAAEAAGATILTRNLSDFSLTQVAVEGY